MLYPRSVNYINVYSLRKKETTAFCLQNSWKSTSSLLFIYEILFTYQEKNTHKNNLTGWIFLQKKSFAVFYEQIFFCQKMFWNAIFLSGAQDICKIFLSVSLKNPTYIYFRNDRKSTKIKLSRRFYFYLMKVVGLQTCNCSDFFKTNSQK